MNSRLQKTVATFDGPFDPQMIYFTFGTKDVLEHECKDLDQRLDLFMDGHHVPLPSIESLVVLNIPCWGAGVRPWTLGAGQSNTMIRVLTVVTFFITLLFLLLILYTGYSG